MSKLRQGRRVWFFWSIIGFALMNVALFLHPMSPEDFLGLAFSDPMQGIFDAQGGAMAIFFWISFALALTGLLGLLASCRLPLLLPPGRKQVLKAAAN